MIKNGANLFAVNNDGKSPFGITLKHKKYKLIDLFIQTASFVKDPKLQFEFCDEIYDPKLTDIYKRILEQEKVNQNEINVLDSEGFTPYLRMIQSIVQIQ